MQPSFFLCVICEPLERTARKDNVGEVRFDDEAAAEKSHQDHGLDGATVEPAVGFRKRYGGPAKLGKHLPGSGAVSAVGSRMLLACLEVIVVGDKFLDAVVQHRLNFVK